MENNTTVYCKYCKNVISAQAKTCEFCQNSQNKILNSLKTISLFIGTFLAIITILLHSISIWPSVKKVIFPNEDIKIVGFKSIKRLVIANTGDFDLFISHVHFGAPQFPYLQIYKELLSITRNIPITEIKLNSIDADLFDTNQDIGKIIKSGDIKKFEFENDFPSNLTFVNGESKERWNRLILIAGINKNSSVIRPIFFSPNDRRLKQIQKNYQGRLNTFEAQGIVFAYSARFKTEVTFPFKILGTVAYNKNKYQNEIESWINPRPGHPEDLNSVKITNRESKKQSPFESTLKLP